jgi:hypothetical protein
MLNRCPSLLNEKPPYYSNYFIHYLVLNGDPSKFARYNLPANKFNLELRNTDGKTALELAQETRNDAFFDEIHQTIPDRERESDSFHVRDDNDRTQNTGSYGSNSSQYTVPVPRVLPPQIRKNLTCPLTKQIFVDPVSASDGKTYERKAIIEYIRDNRYSPLTGEPIDPIFTDDTATKNLITQYRQQKLI